MGGHQVGRAKNQSRGWNPCSSCGQQNQACHSNIWEMMFSRGVFIGTYDVCWDGCYEDSDMVMSNHGGFGPQTWQFWGAHPQEIWASYLFRRCFVLLRLFSHFSHQVSKPWTFIVWGGVFIHTKLSRTQPNKQKCLQRNPLVWKAGNRMTLGRNTIRYCGLNQKSS